MLEKTLESPLDCKEIQPVHPKEISPGCSLVCSCLFTLSFTISLGVLPVYSFFLFIYMFDFFFFTIAFFPLLFYTVWFVLYPGVRPELPWLEN